MHIKQFCAAGVIIAAMGLLQTLNTGAAASGTIRVEAEKMQLDGYSVRSQSFASGGRIISAAGGSDSIWKTASTAFSGDDGVYTINIGYLDVYNGSSTRKLLINGEEKAIWAGNKTEGTSSYSMPQAIRQADLKCKRLINVSLSKDDLITLVGRQDYGEMGQYDYIEFVPGETKAEYAELGSSSMELDTSGFVKSWCSTGLVCCELTNPNASELTDAAERECALNINSNELYSQVLSNGMEFIPISLGNSVYVQDIARGGEEQGNMRLDSYQCTDVIADKTMSVNAVFYYRTGCYDLWLNNVKLKTVTWKYTPIQSVKVKLDLNKGRNRIIIRSQSIANRAGDILVGLQFTDNAGSIRTTIPFDDKTITDFYNAEKCMTGFSVQSGGVLYNRELSNKNAWVRIGGSFKEWGNSESFNLKSMTNVIPEAFSVMIDVGDVSINKDFENRSGLKFEKSNETDITKYREDYALQLYEKNANEGYCTGAKIALKCYMGDLLNTTDKSQLITELKSVDSLMDCSEFSLAHIIRLIKLYPDRLDDEVKSKIKETILNFSYWSDEPGGDTMIRSGENHQAGFYTCMMLAGELYPDELFVRSGRTGTQQAEIAKERLNVWIQTIEKDGFEEFGVGSYLMVTLNNLLNIYDFAEDTEFSERAGRLIDEIFEHAALATFDGMCVGVQGRVYRDVIAKETATEQRLMSYICPSMIQCEETLWTVPIITSSYKIKDDVVELVNSDANAHYISGGTDIKVKKTGDYLLSSISIPSMLPNTSDLTSVFKKGAMLKQVHSWEASIGADARVFVTNPGTYIDGGSQRPDYWYGELSAPKLTMDGSTVCEIYNISGDTVVPFTHAYWPGAMFEEQRIEKNWLFARNGTGYIALWCSSDLIPYSDLLVGCEYRAEGTKTAWICMVSSQAESGGFDEFISECKNRRPEFDKDTLDLTLDGNMVLGWNAIDISREDDKCIIGFSDLDKALMDRSTVIAAEYSDGKLKGIKLIPGSLRDEGNRVTIQDTNTENDMRFMLWRMDDMLPITKSVYRRGLIRSDSQ